MEAVEANKIIIEYMGEDYRSCCQSCGRGHVDYSESLDALVPVWGKLRENGVFINKMTNRSYNHFSMFSDKKGSIGVDYPASKPFDFYESIDNETIQVAAAIATAKAIQSL